MRLKRQRFHLALAAALAMAGCGSTKNGKKSGEDAPPPDDILAPDEPQEPAPSGDAAPVLKVGEGVSARNGKFRLKLAWLSRPAAERHVKARLTFATMEGNAAAVVTDIVFNPQMPSMGHGTATEDQIIAADDESPYVFIVEGIYFIMGGPWEIRVTARVDDTIDTAIIGVDVP